MVFQDALLFPHLDVGGNVAYGVRGAKEARRATVEELLTLVDLPGYAPRPVSTLSGGEAQRVALARALAPAPRPPPPQGAVGPLGPRAGCRARGRRTRPAPPPGHPGR